MWDLFKNKKGLFTFELFGTESNEFLAYGHERLHEFEFGRESRRVTRALELNHTGMLLIIMIMLLLLIISIVAQDTRGRSQMEFANRWRRRR